MGWSPDSLERSGWVIEGFKLICDSNATGSACIDSFAGGVLISVGNDMEVSDNVNGSGQVISSHDASVTHHYGVTHMRYSGTASGSNTTIGTQDASVVVVHTTGLIDGAPQTSACRAIAITQGGDGGSSGS